MDREGRGHILDFRGENQTLVAVRLGEGEYRSSPAW